jgi:hypothetical protein
VLDAKAREICAEVWRTGRQRVDEHAGRGVEVGRHGVRAARPQLRSHVLRRPGTPAAAQRRRGDPGVADDAGAVGIEQDRSRRDVPMDDPGRVEGLERRQSIVENEQCGGRRQAAGDVDELAQGDRIHPFAHDRGMPVVELDNRKEMLVTQRLEHAHVVPGLAAIPGVGPERGAEQPDDDSRTCGGVMGVDERTGAVDADPPIQCVAGHVCPRPGDAVASSLVHSPSVCRHKSAVESNCITGTTSSGH